MKKEPVVILIILSVIIGNLANAQNMAEQGLLPYSTTFNKPRFHLVVISEAGLAAVTTIGLQYLWYKNFLKVIFISLMTTMNG